MKVEIWSDIICPWCGLGNHRLDKALKAFEHGDKVELVHRSFELDPNFTGDPLSTKEMLRKKYRMDDAQLEATSSRIEALAADDGLSPYHVGDNLVGNTHKAHELLALASTKGLQEKAWNHMYKAYFGEQRSIFDVDSLVEIGEEIGLDASEIRQALADGTYREDVQQDLQAARQLGVSGVPFVVVDGKYGISGAQPTEGFQRVLEQAWEERPSLVSVEGSEGACGPEGCDVPPV